MSIPRVETTVPETTDQVTPVEQRRDLEPGLRRMILAALVLLVAVGIVLWTASSVPNGRSVVVTIRNP